MSKEHLVIAPLLTNHNHPRQPAQLAVLMQYNQDDRKNPEMEKIIHWTAFFLLVSTSTVHAQQRESNEVKWRGSIESDIRNGASPSDICSNAQISLKFSDNVSFKDWAYGIIRKYCPEKLGRQQVTPVIRVSPQAQTSTIIQPNCELRLSQMSQLERGEVVRVLGNNCSMVFNAVR